MIRTKRSELSKQLSGINITPFTDVCLVLLIIFMITAPAMLKKNEMGIKIPLPKASSTAAFPTAPLVVSIQRGPKIFVDQKPVTFDTLATEIKKYPVEPDGHLQMVVRAEETVPYYLVIKTIDIAGKAGVSDTLLATRTPEGETPPPSTP